MLIMPATVLQTCHCDTCSKPKGGMGVRARGQQLVWDLRRVKHSPCALTPPSQARPLTPLAACVLPSYSLVVLALNTTSRMIRANHNDQRYEAPAPAPAPPPAPALPLLPFLALPPAGTWLPSATACAPTRRSTARSAPSAWVGRGCRGCERCVTRATVGVCW